MTRRTGPPAVAAAALSLIAACAAPGGSVPASVDAPATASTAASPAASAAASASVTSTPSAGDDELAWSALSVSGPGAREDHTWTVDAEGRRAYLFGGRDGATVYDDLWAYDLRTDRWALLAPPERPPGRFGHEGAWVDGIGLVVFAGQAGDSFFNDLWAYEPDSNAWRLLPSSGAIPVPRYGTCSAVGSDGRLWISHGFTSDGTRFADTRAYDFASGTWSDETPSAAGPVERCLHACWWTDEGELALYAGQTTGIAALGDRWTLGADGWTQVGGSSPPERNLPAHVRLDGSTLVFGGLGLDLALRDDAWLLRDGEADAEQLVTAAAPSGRSGAALVNDAEGARILLFGGRTEDGASAETWQLSGLSDGR